MAECNNKRIQTANNEYEINWMSRVRRDVYDYFTTTTVHGFRYVVEGHNICEKLFWIVLIVIGFSCSFKIIFDSFDSWEQTPLQTTIDRLSQPVQELHFPAITVCNPEETQIPRRNRWMFIEQLLNWIDITSASNTTASVNYHANISL